jgi:hypothetical protein
VKSSALSTWITVATVLAGVVLTGYLFYTMRERESRRTPGQDRVAATPKDVTKAPSSLPPQLLPGRALVGGIDRPASDVVLPDSGSHAPKQVPLKPEGPAPIIPADANEQVAMVHAALVSGEHPERYSSSIVSHSFDAAAFKADPPKYAAEYAKTVEPGRVFATAQPADGVAPLKSVGQRYHRLVQGESVRLTVKAVANAPVTFTSFGTGQFTNLLSSITVVAGDDGQATATFTATSGTKKHVKILAASPLLAEQCAFTVSVQLPENTLASNSKKTL